MSFSPALYDAQLEAAEAETMALEQLRQQVTEFDERLRRVESDISGLRGNQEQMLAMFQRMLLRHEELLNGLQDKPGLIVKVDRLEQSERVRTWNLRAIWVAIIGGIVTVIVDMVQKR